MGITETVDGMCEGCGKSGELRAITEGGVTRYVCFGTALDCAARATGAKTVHTRDKKKELPPAPPLTGPVGFEVFSETPRGQGSVVAVAEGVIAHDNKALVGWRNAVAAAYRSKTDCRAAKGVGVAMTLTFFFVRPKEPTNRFPRTDLDKLIRAVCDGLTGHAYEDDNQVTEIRAIKRYSDQGRSGVEAHLRIAVGLE